VKQSLFLCGLLLLLCSSPLNAQIANNTALVGTITDQSGNVVPNAKVTATNVDTKVEYTAATNPEGYYSIQYVNPGTYDVAVEATGFATITVHGVIVTINISVRTDATLKVGSTVSEVSVSANTPAISTDDALLGETIESERVHDLPLNGRQAIFLAATTSNIVISGTALTGVPPGNRASGAGTRNVSNSITLDGISVVNNLTSTVALTPNPDALESVQTQNGNYTAQYGDYLGVHINMVTRTGGNQFHGTAYDYLQNDALNSKPFGAGTVRKNQVRFNQFGGIVTGPIVKNKAFFLGAYEGIRQNNGTLLQGQVITAKERTGDFSELLNPSFIGKTVQLVDPTSRQPILNNRLDLAGYTPSPQAQNIMQYLSLPTTSSNLATNFVGNGPADLNYDSTLDRVDYNLTENIRLFGRFSWQRMTSESGSINPSSNTFSPSSFRNAAFGYTHILTPRLVNDFRLGFNLVSTNFFNYFEHNGIKGAGSALGIPGFTADVDSNNPGLPTINITNYQGTAGEDGTNWLQDDRTLTLYDQLSWTKNKHNITAGVSFRRLSIGRAATNGPRGTFTFSGQYTGDAAADFFLGIASSDITPFFQVKGEIYQFRDGFFVQDNWQVSQKFTLQYGVRYELPQVAKSLNGVGRKLNADETALFPAQGGTNAANAQAIPGFAFSDPNHTNVAPRVGFSYRATEKTVIRGGGGIYYNANHLNSYTLSSTNYPYSASVTYSGVTAKAGNVPNVTLSNPTPGAGTVSPVAGTPGTYVSAFTEDPHLPPATMYQWNVDVGQEVWKNAGLELQYLGSHTIHLDESFYDNQPEPGVGDQSLSVNARRPNQLFGQIRKIENNGIGTYNGLTVILRQRLNHGLSATASYTWAHALDTSDSSNDGGSAMWQGHLKLDYGNSNYDVRNRFVATFTYELPKFNSQNIFIQEALNGWQVNGILDLRTGVPINVTYSGDRLNVGVPGAAQRPNYVHAAHSQCTKSFLFSHGPAASCLDSTAYSLPAPNSTYGNLHRNDILGPNQLSQNSASLFKSFKIWEDVSFQFRAEAFNVLNHANISASPNPASPNSTFGSSSFGTLVGAGSRTLQLAGKINF
jgi:hypothetical protein